MTRIPADLLHQIFDLSFAGDAPRPEFFQVCREWTRIIEDHSSFWTSIFVGVDDPRSVNTLRRALRCSKRRPLDVRLVLRFHIAEDGEATGADARARRAIVSALAQLAAASARWRSFRMNGTHPDDVALATSCLARVRAPALETLELTDNIEWYYRRSESTERCTSHPTQTTLLAGGLPALRVARIDQRYFCHGVPPLHHLVALRVGVPAEYDSLHALALLRILAAASPGLVCLSVHLRCVTPAPDELVRALGTIRMPALRYLNLEDADQAVLAQVLGALHPPAIKSLHISRAHQLYSDCQFDQDEAFRGGPIENPYAKLQSLVVRDCEDSSELASMLEYLPALRYLTVYNCDFADDWLGNLACEMQPHIDRPYCEKLEVFAFTVWDSDDFCHDTFVDLLEKRIAAKCRLRQVRFHEAPLSDEPDMPPEFVQRVRALVEVSRIRSPKDDELWSDGAELVRRYESQADVDDWDWHELDSW